MSNNYNINNHLINYIHPKDNTEHELPYNRFNRVINDERLQNILSNNDWLYIIAKTWMRSYRLAMEDNVITPKERYVLNGIHSMLLKYSNGVSLNDILPAHLLEQSREIRFIGADYNYSLENEDVGVEPKKEVKRKSIYDIPKYTPYYNS